MERQVDLKDISDGKIYGLNDMVKVCADHCRGCSACCHGRGDTVTLDPLDVHSLKKELSKSFEHLLEHGISLTVSEGLVRPSIQMTEDRDPRCVFLNEQGRCSIHAFRPGLCRLFPLGRVYEEGRLGYILLAGECVRENRTKEKVRKWIDMPNMAAYEAYLIRWHGFIKKVQAQVLQSEEDDLRKQLNMFVLQKFYVEDFGLDFYTEFYERLAAAEKALNFCPG